MILDFTKLTPNQRYGAMTQAIIPRPIAWVLSDNGDGGYNLAPYSFFTGISSDPPLIMISTGKKDANTDKDTRVNIRERKNFVIHIAGTKHIEQVNASSATLPHGESEVEKLNLKLVEIEGFDLPRIESCDIAIACSLYRIDEIGNVPQAVIYGEIKQLIINDSLVKTDAKGRLAIDSVALDPLSRLGGSLYAGIANTLTAHRPK